MEISGVISNMQPGGNQCSGVGLWVVFVCRASIYLCWFVLQKKAWVTKNGSQASLQLSLSRAFILQGARPPKGGRHSQIKPRAPWGGSIQGCPRAVVRDPAFHLALWQVILSGAQHRTCQPCLPPSVTAQPTRVVTS